MSTAAVDSSGGTVVMSITTTADCAWTAAADSNWISDLTPASGQGTGQLQFKVAPNPDPVARAGDVVLNGEHIQIRQQAAPCRFEMSPVSQTIGAAGGSVTVAVTTASACSWTATSGAVWIAVTNGASGNGNGNVTLQIAANSGAARAGTATIGGQTFTANQAGAAPPVPTCSYTLDPVSQTVPSASSSGQIAVKTGSTCPWTASVDASWIEITAGKTGSGNGTVSFAIAQNVGPSRTASVTVAGVVATITQTGTQQTPCAYTITPTTQAFASSGAIGATIGVASPAGCPWSSASNQPWLTITGGNAGSGNGNVVFNVAANGGPARSAVVTIAGQQVGISQAAACAFAINPASQSFPIEGGAGGPVAVASAAGCAWTSTSGVPWITFTNSASGTSNGSVSFVVAANAGSARNASITIAGQPFAVMQAGCSYSVDPSSQTIAPDGGAGKPVTVTTTAGCSWTASSNDTWITITSGDSHTGSGTVKFTVAANPGNKRTGSLTVAGQTVTITQDKR